MVHTKTRDEFHANARANWIAAMKEAVGPDPQLSQAWTGMADIQRVLKPFMGQGRNHAHYPGGGGMDFLSVQPSRETGCLEFLVEERIADILRPKILTMEYIPEAPAESFLYLELGQLALSGVYPSVTRRSEELVELRPGKFVERGVWDDGYYGHDADGRELPLPPDARLVYRWLGGSIMLVAKGSLWNGDPKTYAGTHESRGAKGAREMIVQALQRR